MASRGRGCVIVCPVCFNAKQFDKDGLRAPITAITPAGSGIRRSLYLGGRRPLCINEELAGGTNQEVRPVLTVISCPECEVPAEVTDRFSLTSTDGPVDCVALSCVAGHHFRMPSELLPVDSQDQLQAREPVPARPSSAR